MKLSMSNIAWGAGDDAAMHAFLRGCGFDALEIAPTRWFPQAPYEHAAEARERAQALRREYGLGVSSMQSIWYGRAENIFDGEAARSALAAYTARAVDFAAAVGCGNLVFGCPKNRNHAAGGTLSEADRGAARAFFTEIATYAWSRGVVVAIEPNPPIYGTNFLNTTQEAVDFCKALDLPGLRVNVDVGTCVHYGEGVDVIRDNLRWVHHIHLSEPMLAPLERRALHAEIARLPFEGYASVEMGRREDGLEAARRAAEYAAGVFRHGG